MTRTTTLMAAVAAALCLAPALHAAVEDAPYWVAADAPSVPGAPGADGNCSCNI